MPPRLLPVFYSRFCRPGPMTPRPFRTARQECRHVHLLLRERLVRRHRPPLHQWRQAFLAVLRPRRLGAGRAGGSASSRACPASTGPKPSGISASPSARHLHAQDQDTFAPDPADRPYAGWCCLRHSFLSKTEHVADTVSFQLGLAGRHSDAQDLQQMIHEWLNGSRPNC